MIAQEVKYAYTDAEMDAILKALTAKKANRLEVIRMLQNGKLTGGSYDTGNR